MSTLLPPIAPSAYCRLRWSEEVLEPARDVLNQRLFKRYRGKIGSNSWQNLNMPVALILRPAGLEAMIARGQMPTDADAKKALRLASTFNLSGRWWDGILEKGGALAKRLEALLP